jgi:starch synthase
MQPTLNVLFLAAEADPFVKVGGLGDVAGSLPLALRSLTPVNPPEGLTGENPEMPLIDIRLMIPYHKIIQAQDLTIRSVAKFKIDHTSGPIPVEVFETRLDDLPVYLVASDLITQDDQIYHPDAALDGPKFTLFSLAALELVKSIRWKPDILHANDWHTALSLYALSLRRIQDRYFQKTLALLSVHNMPYLGVGAGIALAPFGLSPAYDSALPWWAQDMPLPLGLLSADHIVAVSPGYAQEILTPDFGSGLHEFLQSRGQDITGILNGLDTRQWDPSTDSALTMNYSVESAELRLANKTALQDEIGLPIDPDIPLLVMITRLDPQKGVDLLPDALDLVRDLPWQMFILGTGDPALEAMMSSLESSIPVRLRAAIRFDTNLSRRVYSGADAILIPSRYEPCGLTQMISMRYGCVPIAHATGGLRDTIRDYTDFGQSTGFLFQDLSSEGLAAAIRRALNVYVQTDLWSGLQQRGMKKDFSWTSSAKKYYDLYLSLFTSLSSEKMEKVES